MPRAWLVIILLAAGCTTATTPSPSVDEGVAGGTLRVGLWKPEDAPPELSQWLLDPHRYFWHPFARCCLLRTLLSYSGRAIEDGGSQLQPDVAESMPEVSADGLTWTFRLRPGLRYAPPFDEREIVARDFITALERTVRLGESPYHDVIEGVGEFRDGSAGTISGAQAPDDHTLVFRLTEPAGDFGNRVAMPFLAPVPAEALAEHEDNYGGYVVASGPYMIEGAEAIDYDDPAAPPVGDVAGLALVRNPSWIAETDPLRPAFVDRIEVVTLLDRGEAFVEAGARGEIDVGLDPMLATARNDVVADPALRPRLREVPYPTLFFIPLNLAQPPFDDVAVRRAVNAVIDRAALVEEFDPNRGSSFVPVAHVFPDVAVAGLLRDYVPAGIGTGGDPEGARALMAGSAYDTDGDGRCDGDVCTVIANSFGATTETQLETVRANLAELGIEVEWVEEPQMADPAAHVALAALFGWTADYPSANDFSALMIDPGTTDNLNFSLIGASPEQLADWGYSVSEVASVDDKFGACRTRGGSSAFSCWAELDQLMSEQVVAWIPVASHLAAHLISDRIDRFEFAGSETLPAMERISIRPEAAP